jgi:ubiquinone/menaquinone biosynthesis C-methylase UbiE
MSIKESYNLWASQYDTNPNKTRDLEAISLRETLANVPINNCFEIGCGTGKNTIWLTTKADRIVAVDLSEEMLVKAKEKIQSKNVIFLQADITNEWTFVTQKFDLITFSLVLEHIEDLDKIFSKASNAIIPGGYVYVGELHPFKQYAGSKAKFETADGTHVVNCFMHHVSDFTQAARQNGFGIVSIQEYFDDRDRTGIPRVLALLLRKI